MKRFGRFKFCKDDQGSPFGLHQPPALMARVVRHESERDVWEMIHGAPDPRLDGYVLTTAPTTSGRAASSAGASSRPTASWRSSILARRFAS